MARGIQTYLCRGCNLRFSSSRRSQKDDSKQLWKEYVFDKQTVIQLARKNRTAKSRIQ
jgi:transposase-like protein